MLSVAVGYRVTGRRMALGLAHHGRFESRDNPVLCFWYAYLLKASYAGRHDELGVVKVTNTSLTNHLSSALNGDSVKLGSLNIMIAVDAIAGIVALS